MESYEKQLEKQNEQLFENLETANNVIEEYKKFCESPLKMILSSSISQKQQFIQNNWNTMTGLPDECRFFETCLIRMNLGRQAGHTTAMIDMVSKLNQNDCKAAWGTELHQLNYSIANKSPNKNLRKYSFTFNLKHNNSVIHGHDPTIFNSIQIFFVDMVSTVTSGPLNSCPETQYNLWIELKRLTITKYPILVLLG